jgi:hypothetical protein
MPTRERPARKARLQAEAAIAKLNTGGKATKGRNTTPGGTKPSTRAQAEQAGEPLNQALAQAQQEPAGQPEANPPQLMRGGDGKDDGGDKPEQKEEEASTAPLPEKVGIFVQQWVWLCEYAC